MVGYREKKRKELRIPLRFLLWVAICYHMDGTHLVGVEATVVSA